MFIGLTQLSIGQNTVTVDANATQNGFANVFETPANGGGYVFGSSWGVPDLQTIVDTGANTLTLQPNFNTYGDNPLDPFWVDQTTGIGNKVFEGNTFVEDNTLVGSELTFTGGVTANTIDAGYEVLAFIKVFNSDFSVLKEENAPLVGGTNFTVVYTNVEAPDAVVQYGFKVTGINANPADEPILGSVIVGGVLGVNSFDAINLSTFPNPVSDKWNIQAEENITQITIHNILGQQIFVAAPNVLNFTVNTASFESGVYLATINTTVGSKTIKVVKK